MPARYAQLNEMIKQLTIIISFLIVILGIFPVYGQTNISITIDDVPNTRKFQQDNFQSDLLTKLDSIEIPITIFINEGLIYKTDSFNKNFKLLNDWIQPNYVTVGNHTFSHSRYSDVGFDSFKIDIEKGESITRELTKKHNKLLSYFRFPYNDLGKDSIQHNKIDSLLQTKNYISAPFTIESSDWMFNYIYEYYLKKSDLYSASKIGDLYVTKTLEYIEFFDSLSVNKYGRKINQIYLCHDNSLNANYLIEIISRLKEQNYNFISLEKTLEDDAYQQVYRYYRKWGVSWLYRWMPTQKERVKWMKKEPNIDYTYNLYNNLVNQTNKDK
jgi:peptidoglycan/xylan/chitin deacetylase (PgdA/CDA1 family)